MKPLIMLAMQEIKTDTVILMVGSFHHLGVEGRAGDMGGHGVVRHVTPRMVLSCRLSVPYISSISCQFRLPRLSDRSSNQSHS